LTYQYLTAVLKTQLKAPITLHPFCPGLVDTPLAAGFGIPPEEMVRPEDLADAVRWLVRLSSKYLIPEISFARPNGRFDGSEDET